MKKKRKKAETLGQYIARRQAEEHNPMTVRSGEIILTKEQQDRLGGPDTFRNITVYPDPDKP